MTFALTALAAATVALVLTADALDSRRAASARANLQPASMRRRR